MQYGFFFDQSRCTGCQVCTVACKSSHDLPPGPLKYLRIYQYERGAFPEVRLQVQWVPCYHCKEPVCAENCPTEAIYKEEGFGAVLVDPDMCIGCRMCYDECPYGAPVFESDDPDCVAQKCDMCVDRLKEGKKPICVMACPLRALDFGPLAELEATYGQLKALPDLPDSGTTEPSVVFKKCRDKVDLVPFDVEKARTLFMKRDPLPPLFSAVSEVTDIPQGMVGRDQLVLKHASCAELMKFTRNDEG